MILATTLKKWTVVETGEGGKLQKHWDTSWG
jgi:hypothetical protein